MSKARLASAELSELSSFDSGFSGCLFRCCPEQSTLALKDLERTLGTFENRLPTTSKSLGCAIKVLIMNLLVFLLTRVSLRTTFIEGAYFIKRENDQTSLRRSNIVMRKCPRSSTSCRFSCNEKENIVK